MQILDEAIVLCTYRHGENSQILTAFSKENGRLAGFVPGGMKSGAGLFQPGNIIQLTWKARLEEHLGSIKGELIYPTAARFMDKPDILLMINAICDWCHMSLPDRQPYPDLYAHMHQILHSANADHYAAQYALWELALLQHVGFGLDLHSCALTGANDNLAYVSPKTGRAVSFDASEPWRDKLLPLPIFMRPCLSAANDNPPLVDILQGLRLTGHFLQQHVLQPKRKNWPVARTLLIRKLLMLQEQAG